MYRGIPAVAISIAIYFVLSFSTEAIHNIFDPYGLKNNETLALTIAGMYNVVFFILTGFFVAYLYNGKERNIAAITGLILVVLNFFAFIVFQDELPFVFKMLKVVIPLHAAMLGGALRRKLAKTS